MTTPVCSVATIRRIIIEQTKRAGVGYIVFALSIANIVAVPYARLLKKTVLQIRTATVSRSRRDTRYTVESTLTPICCNNHDRTSEDLAVAI